MIKHSTGLLPTGLAGASFCLFIFILLFSPLAFGTTESWSLFVVELLLGLAACFYMFPFSGEHTFLKVPGAMPLCLFLVWMYVQCLPLPPSLVHWLSPAVFSAYQPILDVTSNSGWIPLTVHQKVSVLESLRMTACAIVYVLTVHLCANSRRLIMVVRVVVGLVSCIAFLAIIQKMSSPDKIYWFRQVPASAWRGALGPWVYPNQYAGFMVMVLPLILALLYYHRPVVTDSCSWRQRLVGIFFQPTTNLSLLLWFGVLVIILSIFLSLSRGGIISLCGAVVLFFVLLGRHHHGRKGYWLAMIVSFVFLLAFMFNGVPVIEKFLYSYSPESGGIRDGRLLVWQDSLRIIRDFPITGSGFGSFADVFPGYKSFTDNYIYDHAHNDYLELLANGGLIGLVLAGFFITTVIRVGMQQISTRHDTLAIVLAIGSLSGIVGMLIYSLTDFNLHNGADGLYFFFLCGLLVAAGYTKRHDRGAARSVPEERKTGVRVLVFVWGLCFTVAVVFLHGGMLRADGLYSKVQILSSSMLRPAKKVQQATYLLQQAMRADPLTATYPYVLANIEKYGGHSEAALGNYYKAARLQPLEGAFYIAAARMLKPADPLKKRLLHVGSKRKAGL